MPPPVAIRAGDLVSLGVVDVECIVQLPLPSRRLGMGSKAPSEAAGSVTAWLGRD